MKFKAFPPKKRLIIIGIVLFSAALIGWILLARPAFDFDADDVMSVEASPVLLKEHVVTLSEKMGDRDYKNHENLDKVADYIANKLKSYCARVTEQPFEVKGLPFKNVLAEYGPEDGEVIVIGAHYDTCGPEPGADDNASSVAGLIELGGLLQKSELKKRVILAAYCLEEPPFFGGEEMGSFIHAKSLKDADTKVKLMIALDMIGYFSDESWSQAYPLPLLYLYYPTRGNFIAVVDQTWSSAARDVKIKMAEAIDLPVYSMNAPVKLPGVDFSDHRNFWKMGYDAVMITDTAFFRNKEYHTSKDTADRLDYDKMAQVVKGLHHCIVKLTNE